jgi:hypothetical protein
MGFRKIKLGCEVPGTDTRLGPTMGFGEEGQIIFHTDTGK